MALRVDCVPRVAVAGTVPPVKMWRLAVGVSFIASLLRTNESTLLPSLAVNALQFGPLLGVSVFALARPAPDVRVSGARGYGVALMALVAVAASSAFVAREPAAVVAQAAVFAVVALFLIATIQRRWHDSDLRDGDLCFVFWLGVSAQAVGLVAHFTAQEWAMKDYGRYAGVLFNANYAGMSAALLVLLALHLRGKTALGFPILLAALLLSGSRGAMLGVIVALVGVFILTSARAKILVYVWALALAATLALILKPETFAPVTDAFSRVRQGGGLLSGRLDVYEQVVAHWKESPIFGMGYRQAEVQASSAVEGMLTAHNIYLSVLAEMGLLGAVVFVCLMIQIFRTGDRRHPLLAPALVMLTIELTQSSLFGLGNPTSLMAWLLFTAFVSTGPLDAGKGSTQRSPSDTQVPGVPAAVQTHAFG